MKSGSTSHTEIEGDLKLEEQNRAAGNEPEAAESNASGGEPVLLSGLSVSPAI